MDEQLFSTLLPQVIELAKEAGKAILPFYQKLADSDIKNKLDQTPVTQADIAADQVIQSGLKELTPDWPILSEESDQPAYAIRKTWSRYWLVDPLDGTRGFIRHSPEFTVNIALIDNGVPILGVIEQPVTGECFYALANESAFMELPGQSPVKMQLQQRASEILRVLCGHFDRSMHFVKKAIPPETPMELIKMNSSLKFAALARGVGDLYCRFGPTSEWDTAAGQCILTAAGGAVVDFQGKPLQYNAKSILINPSFVAVADRLRLPATLKLIHSIRR